MERESLRASLACMLEEEMGESYELRDETELREGLGLDSVDVVGLVMRVERQYRIRLAMEELAEMKQVGQFLDLIMGKLGAVEGSSPELGRLGSATAA
jgi:acyl carrier protein